MPDATNGRTTATAARIGLVSLLALVGLLALAPSASAQVAAGWYSGVQNVIYNENAGEVECWDDSGSLRFEAPWAADTLEIAWSSSCDFRFSTVHTPATLDCEGDPGRFRCRSTVSKFEFRYSGGEADVVYDAGVGRTGYLFT